MDKFIQKLSSRKFWALVSALVVSVMTAFGADSGTQERVAGVIAAVSAVMVYTLAEAYVDSKRGDK